MQAVALECLPGAVDPWPHPTQPLGVSVRMLLPHFIVAPLSHGPVVDHLHAGPYRAASTSGALSCVLTAPSAYAADLVVGLSAMFATRAVFVLVPLTFVSHAPGGRRAFLTRLSSAGRLRIVLGVPVTPGTVQMTWLCIFADKACLAGLLRVIST